MTLRKRQNAFICGICLSGVWLVLPHEDRAVAEAAPTSRPTSRAHTLVLQAMVPANAPGRRRWIAEDPFWISGNVWSESVFFIQREPTERPRAALLFVPKKIEALRPASGEGTYEPGRDYIWQPGARWIELPPESRIPFKTLEEVHPLPGSPDSYPSVRGQDRHILFGEGHFYHDLQAQVDYVAAPGELDWPVTVQSLRQGELPGMREKLRRGEPLSVALFGDSISAGSNATAFINAPPWQPAYGDLVVGELAARFGSKISFTNYSRGGKTSQWGMENVAPAAEAEHDLVLLAWGMNDVSTGVSPESYRDHIAAQIAAIRAVNPEVEFVLISSMRANPAWSASTPELFPQYVEALQDLTDERAVLADVTSVWTELLRRKSFYSLTGNGVNHPNDFGHRVYARVVLSRLTPEEPAGSINTPAGDAKKK